jgi:hypothetical protein
MFLVTYKYPYTCDWFKNPCEVNLAYLFQCEMDYKWWQMMKIMHLKKLKIKKSFIGKISMYLIFKFFIWQWFVFYIFLTLLWHFFEFTCFILIVTNAMSSFQKFIMSPLCFYKSSIILKIISIKVDCNPKKKIWIDAPLNF